jgi:hypothetical protein
VYKSIDGGATWQPSSAGLPSYCKTLAIHPREPATLYAATFQGIFKSTDGGASWVQTNLGLSNLNVVDLVLNTSGIHASTPAGVFGFATRFDTECLPPPPLVAAVLPASRSVQVGTIGTAFVSIANAGFADTVVAAGDGEIAGSDGVRCGITQLTGVPTPFSFQATDPRTHEPIADLNMPVDIPPGASQSFLISLTPTAAFDTTEVRFGFNCTNTELASTIAGVNTLQISASDTPVPDVIALAATLNGDGIVNVPGSNGIGVFSVATINVGTSGVLWVSADTGSAMLPVAVSVCETHPVTGYCLAEPAPQVARLIEANETPTFGVFVAGSGTVAFDPGTNRVFVRFTDAPSAARGVNVATRGATSVAVRTQ